MDRQSVTRPWPRGWLRPLIWCAIAASIGWFGCRRESDDVGSVSVRPNRAGASLQPKQIDLERPVVRIETNFGAITVELDAIHAPGTVRNFLNYVGDSFYNGTLFHYVAPNKMIVGGGYTADHQLKPVQTPIRNEAHNGLKNVRGTLSMARDPSLVDGATSQFFINLIDAPQFDHRGDTAEDYGYCVFGKVIDGLDVADRISQLPTKDFGGDLVQTPDPPVVIQTIRLVM